MLAPDLAPRAARRGRLNLLDALRFCAALAVVAYHFTTYPYQWGWDARPVTIFGPLTMVTGYGYLGVYLFFIISGFVIMMSAWGRTTGQFVASRLARLFPAYWVAVPLAGIVAVLIIDGRVTADNLRTTAVNMTMLNKPFGVPYVDGVYWTLWVELCFYLIVGILIVTGLTYRKVLALAALWPLLAILVKAGNKQFAEILQPDFAPLFAGGIALYLLYAHGHTLLHWMILGVNAVLAANNAALTASWVHDSTGARLSGAVAFCVILAFFAAVAIATLTPARTWTGTAGTSLGRLTYPLYLVHVYPGLIVIHYTQDILGTWGALALGIAVAITLAWLVNRFVERPFASRMRARIERTFDRSKATGPVNPVTDLQRGPGDEPAVKGP
ncbi:acyltransferase [Leifsonia sp. NCR5]|uniref:acyltransferase family protein n=1 Tax=Leifsonia sp. NCR5 TaxID=1978342 RepID=UPI000A192E57|nr:acyltransferase [Leifsonia sp. NCR5]